MSEGPFNYMNFIQNIIKSDRIGVKLLREMLRRTGLFTGKASVTYIRRLPGSKFLSGNRTDLFQTRIFVVIYRECRENSLK